MDKVYIVGHKNPDTDSVCSSIAYSNFKKHMGIDNCIPARLGKINKETEFVLGFFNQPVPELIENVLAQVSDIDYYKLNFIYPYMTIKQVWDIMKSTETKLMPIIDSPDKKKMLGVISMGDITRFHMEKFEKSSLAKYKSSFYNVAQVLNAEVLHGEDKLFSIIEGNIEIYSNVEMIKELEKDTVMIVGDTKNINEIFDANLKGVILANGCYVEKIPDTFKGIVMVTRSSLLEVVMNISLAIPVGEIMKTEGIIYFNENDYIDEIKDLMVKWRFRHFPIVDSENNVVGSISRRHLLNIPRKKVIIVDHNEKSQSVEGLEQAQVLEIIDHHRVADIQTNYPVYFRNEPVGSTATIVASMYFENGLIPDKTTAGLLMSAIISDTLLFKSPTCTRVDRTMAEKLSAIAQLDINKFGKQMLHAGASLKDKSPEELLNNDFKEFSFNKYHFAVAQVNTSDKADLEELRSAVMEYIRRICSERGYSLLALMVTDIINGGSEILYAGEFGRVIKELFNSESEDTTGFLPGVISRKKQVVPQILNKLSSI